MLLPCSSFLKCLDHRLTSMSLKTINYISDLMDMNLLISNTNSLSNVLLLPVLTGLLSDQVQLSRSDRVCFSFSILVVVEVTNIEILFVHYHIVYNSNSLRNKLYWSPTYYCIMFNHSVCHSYFVITANLNYIHSKVASISSKNF